MKPMLSLSETERIEAQKFVRQGKANARTITRAWILLAVHLTRCTLQTGAALSSESMLFCLTMPGIGRALFPGVHKERLLCLATRRFCLVSLLLSAVAVLAWPVAQPTACQDDNQQCWHHKGDEAGQVYAGLVHGEKEWYPNKLRGIDAGMQQGSDENASSGVVEDPRKDDG